MDNKKDVNIPISTGFVDDVKHIIDQGHETAYITVNSTMIATYWNKGRRIVKEEQHGFQMAGYGTELIKTLAQVLMHEYGSGFSESYLAYFLTKPDLEILQTRLQNLRNRETKRTTHASTQQHQRYLTYVTL